MKRVLIVGAGFNKNFKEDIIDIPILNEIFMDKFLKKGIENYSHLYTFLSKYCNYKKQTLKNETIDIEEIFTLLQQKLGDDNLSFQELKCLVQADNEFRAIIKAHYYDDSFLDKLECINENDPYWSFIKFLNKNKVDMITFNYDDVIEYIKPFQ